MSNVGDLYNLFIQFNRSNKQVIIMKKVELITKMIMSCEACSYCIGFLAISLCISIAILKAVSYSIGIS